MKKLALFLAFFLIIGQAFAQNSNVRKADRALENGDLQEAKKLINEATEHEKTKDDPKTWYTQGTIYQALLNQEGFSEELVEGAMKSYNKVFDMVEENDKYFTLTDLKVQELWGGFINQGSEAYSAEDFEEAINAFERALLVLPEDTTATLYAGIASQQVQDNEKALKYYYRLIDLDYHEPDIYASIISIERYENEDVDKALEMIRTAKEKFPENDDFNKQEINLLIAAERVDEAKNRINEAIEKEPENANLYFNLGVLYQELAEYAISIQEKLQIGMKEDKLLENLGQPNEKNVTQTEGVKKTQYVYDNNLYVYVENGSVTAIQYKEKGETGDAEIFYDLAERAYKKAIEIDPEYLDANYNYAVYYYNKAADLFAKARNMDLQTYRKKGKAIEEEAIGYLEKAKPYFEKSLELAPNEIQIIETLQTLYTQLKENDKAEEMMNRADELKEGNE